MLNINNNNINFFLSNLNKLIDEFFNKQNPNSWLNYKVYIGLVFIIIFIITFLTLNVYEIKNKDYQIIILLIFSILLLSYYFFIFRNEQSIAFENLQTRTLLKKNNEFNKDNYIKSIKTPLQKLLFSFFSFIGIIISIVLIVGLFFWSIHNSSLIFNIFQLLIFILMIIIFLSIIAKIFQITLETCNINNFDKLNIIMKIVCLIKNLIFFLPCLLLIYISNIRKEFKNVPHPIVILLISELLLVTFFLFLPILYNFISNFNGNKLLDGPIYLNNKKTIGAYQEFNKNFKKDKKKNIFNTKFQIYNPYDNEQSLLFQLGSLNNIKKIPYKYTYSISFKIYINPQDTNTNYSYNKLTSLFNYAYKPIIYYNGVNQTIVIKTKTVTNEGNQLDTVYKTNNFKFQKWIPFIINYENNKIDIFMNSKLVGSKENVPPYFDNDYVIVGEKNGIHGSISDIYYYDKLITPDKFQSFF